MAENQDYTKSVNLPSTDFPMRGNLPQREPETLKYWEDIDLYNRLKKKNKGKKPFILHDGPPYGRIVMIIVPYTSMIFNTQHKAASFLAVSA